MNLLKETMDCLNRCGKDFYADVEWIGSSRGNYIISKEEFLVLANVEYDNGYGSAEVFEDLVRVGNDWWLSREEYDGSEWWKFNSMPVPAENWCGFDTLIDTSYYGTIESYMTRGKE